MSKKIKVMIIDDSAVVRSVLAEILEKDPQIEISGSAADPIFAERHLEKVWPDVIVLDIEMPRMDGITFLKKIMKEHPTPVVICSTLTKEGAEVTMEAVSSGAVEIITKPELGLKGFLEESAQRFVQSVKAAAMARINKVVDITESRKSDNLAKKFEEAPEPKAPPPSREAPARTGSVDPSLRKVAPKLTADAILPGGGSRAMSVTTDKVVAIGASTGGTQALEIVLKNLPRTAPGIVIVQHMPENFTGAFASRLNDVCEIEVIEGKDDDRIIPGRAIIANGAKHLTIVRSGAQYRVKVVDGPLVSRHRPSVDVLFRSAAREAGKNALGVIMTGMGDDGASGLLEMRNAGAETIAQDEDTCIVFGMPAEAIKRDAATKVASLYAIPRLIKSFN